MGVDALVVALEVTYDGGGQEPLHEDFGGAFEAGDGVESGRDLGTVEKAQDSRNSSESKAAASMDSRGPISYPELTVDSIDQDGKLYADFRDRGAETLEERGLVLEDTGVNRKGTESVLAVPSASDLEFEDGIGVGEEVDNDSVLEGPETDDAGESGPEGTGIADKGTGSAGGLVSRRLAFSARCFAHNPSNSLLTRAFHICVDSVVGRSGITYSKNGSSGREALNSRYTRPRDGSLTKSNRSRDLTKRPAIWATTCPFWVASSNHVYLANM